VLAAGTPTTGGARRRNANWGRCTPLGNALIFPSTPPPTPISSCGSSQCWSSPSSSALRARARGAALPCSPPRRGGWPLLPPALTIIFRPRHPACVRSEPPGECGDG
jgi:hypothetical protein